LHPFRFNVRELKEITTQLRIDGADHKELPLTLVRHRLERPFGGAQDRPAQEALPAPAMSEDPEPSEIRNSKLPAPTREEVEALLKTHDGNISQIARALGRSRRQVYRYLEQWGLLPEEE